MTIDKYIKAAVFLAATAVTLGALGAHTLKELISESQLHSFETGVRYQLFHAITLLILSLNNKKFNRHLKKSLRLMITGVCLFSFSIYLLSIKDLINVPIKLLAPITPLGGVLLIFGWLILLISIKK